MPALGPPTKWTHTVFRTVGEHRHQPAHYDDAGHDVEAHADAARAPVEERLEQALSAISVADLAIPEDVVALGHRRHRRLLPAVLALAEDPHETHADHAAEDGSEVAQQDGARQRSLRRRLAEHEGGDDQAHPEDRAEVDQGGDLPPAEGLDEALVGRQRHDRRVGQVGGDDADRGDSRQAEQGPHRRGEDPVGDRGDPDLRYEGGEAAGQDHQRHQEEDEVQDQVVRRRHHGVEHGGQPHPPGEDDEERGEDGERDPGLQRDRRHQPRLDGGVGGHPLLGLHGGIIA